MSFWPPMPVPSRPGGRPAIRRSVSMRRGAREAAPIHHYTGRVTGLPINQAQVAAIIGASGTANGSVGPSGLGTIWYPASVTFSTSVVPFDAVIVNVYMGGLTGRQEDVVGTLIGGNGTIALAIPALPAGLQLFFAWSQGSVGSQVTAFVNGTYDALIR